MEKDDPQEIRLRFLRKAREIILKNHGLPPDAPPDRVHGLLKFKEKMRRLNEIARKNENNES